MSTRARKKRSIYSKGEINRLIDCLLHPLSDINPAFSLVDAILHGVMEQNPPETALKFLRYNLQLFLNMKRKRREGSMLKLTSQAPKTPTSS